MSLVNLIAKYFVPISIFMYLLGLASKLPIILSTGEMYFLDWKMTQYHVSYWEFGFIKRGLIGSILSPFLAISADGIFAKDLFIILLDLFVVLAILYAVKKVFEEIFPDDSELAAYLKVAIAVAPIGFIQLSWDVGRFDHLNILVFLFSAIALLRHRYLYCGIAMTVGVLMHEAIFIFGVPVVFAYAILSKIQLRGLAIIFVPIGLAAMAVLFFGNSSVDIASVWPEELSKGARVWSRGVIDPPEGATILHVIVLLFYTVVPYLFLFTFYKSNKIKLDILYLSALAPIALFAMGLDYFRWEQLIFISVVAVILFHAVSGKTKLDMAELPAIKPLFFLYLMPLGPIGIWVNDALPFVQTPLRILIRQL